MKIRHLLLIASAFAISPFYSCEDESITEPQTQNDISIFASSHRTTTKGAGGIVAKKYSTVESLDYNLDPEITVTYNTIKLRNKDHSIMQEWFLENYREDVFGYRTFNLDLVPNDLQYGLFYSWGNFDDKTQEDYDDLFSKRGFHLPTGDDINKLVTLYGANKARDMLGLFNEDLRRYVDVYEQNDPRRYYKPIRDEIFIQPTNFGPLPMRPNCGPTVFLGGTPPNDVAYIFPNTEVYCLVRFVRDLTEDEW